MKTSDLLFFKGIILFVLSCTIPQKNGKIVTRLPDGHIKVQTYENGVLIEDRQCLKIGNKEINDGYDKRYKNGKLFLVAEYKNDLADGEVLGYYEDGKTLQSKGHFREGKQVGVFETFHKNGTKFQIEHFFYGAKNGAQYYYDSLGELYSYDFIIVGKKELVFDIDAKPKITGHGVVPWCLNPKKTYNKTDTANFNLIVACPEDNDFSYDLSVYNKKYKKVVHFSPTSVHKMDSINLNIISFDVECIEGSQHLSLISKINYKKKHTYCDTSYINVIVK